MMAFNIVDVTIIFLLGLSILVGILRGATREVLGIAGWVGALAIVFYGLPLIRPLARQYILNPMIADALVAAVLFILSLAFFILISRVLSSKVKGSLLSGLDRSLGLVFGFLRGILFICLVYLGLGFFYPPGKMPDAIKTARFTPWFMRGAHELKHFIPKDYIPHKDMDLSTINPLDAKDLIENTLPSLEETVKNLSTLRPTSPKKINNNLDTLERLIKENDAEIKK